VAAQPAAKESAKLIAMLPNAADRYRKQINLGLDGDPREALKARVVLRKMVKKDIVLEPDGEGGLWASYELQPAALLSVAVGLGGAQERTNFTVPEWR
jgi:hypothetical protein